MAKEQEFDFTPILNNDKRCISVPISALKDALDKAKLANANVAEHLKTPLEYPVSLIAAHASIGYVIGMIKYYLYISKDEGEVE